MGNNESILEEYIATLAHTDPNMADLKENAPLAEQPSSLMTPKRIERHPFADVERNVASPAWLGGGKTRREKEIGASPEWECGKTRRAAFPIAKRSAPHIDMTYSPREARGENIYTPLTPSMTKVGGHPTGWLGRRRYMYRGENSEGNRFILDDDL